MKVKHLVCLVRLILIPDCYPFISNENNGVSCLTPALHIKEIDLDLVDRIPNHVFFTTRFLGKGVYYLGLSTLEFEKQLFISLIRGALIQIKIIEK